MNSETPSSESAPPSAKSGTTLQAVLQSSDGTMDSIAVPVPLPDVIIRVHSESSGPVESHFRRARTADSVLRYVEEEETSRPVKDATRATPMRRCASCHGVSSIYYVPKLPPHETVSPSSAAYCAQCYAAAAAVIRVIENEPRL